MHVKNERSIPIPVAPLSFAEDRPIRSLLETRQKFSAKLVLDIMVPMINYPLLRPLNRDLTDTQVTVGTRDFAREG